MSDEQRITIARVLQVVVPIASVAVAVTSLVLSLSGRRKELACIYLGAERLVSVSHTLTPDFSVQYHGAAVTSLTKMNFVVRNAGAAAIKGTDIMEPLGLDFPEGTKILSAAVDRTLPSEFTFKAAPDQNSNSVLLDFPLLNPGDEAYVGVYVYNSEPKYPKLRGRVVDVHLSEASDVRESQGRALPFVANATTRAFVFWALIIINALIATALFGFWLLAVWRTAVASSWRRRWKGAFAAAIEEVKGTDDFEYNWITQRMDRVGKSYVSLKDTTVKLLKQKGIPEPPVSNLTFDTIAEGLGVTFLLLGLTTLFLFTCLYIYTAPR